MHPCWNQPVQRNRKFSESKIIFVEQQPTGKTKLYQIPPDRKIALAFTAW